MSEIDFAAVMTALTQVAVDAGVVERAYDWPTADINPPCLVAGYPEGPQGFDATMYRGHDRALFPVYIVVGAMVKRETRDRLAPYLTPFKAAIETAATYGETMLPVPWASTRVESWDIVPFAVESLDYMAIKFAVDVLT
jgi:hypothetical protein